jgi:BCD family chlorophyll transporter-like MFS transporter
MYLLGMGIAALVVGWLLRDYDPLKLVQVVQGCALATLVLNLLALWKQERVRPMSAAERAAPRPAFRDAWADLAREEGVLRLLAVVVLGTLAFNMQDVLLEPYGGQILGLSVAATTVLTATWACGALLGFLRSARRLARGGDPVRLAAQGLLLGIAAFSCVIFAGPMQSPALFYLGAAGIGLGGGTFGMATLAAVMAVPGRGAAGLALGAWGAAQATAAGLAIFAGGALRDAVDHVTASGFLGAIADPALGYSVVYHAEIGLLFLTLAVLGPLVRLGIQPIPKPEHGAARIGLAEFPT